MDTYYYIPPYANEYNNNNMDEENPGCGTCIGYFIFTLIVAVVVFIIMRNY